MGFIGDKRKLTALLLLSIMVFVAFLLYIDPSAFAQEDTLDAKGKITEPLGVYVRSGPSTSTSKVNSAINGKAFTIYEEKFTKNDDSKDTIWYKTSLNGYIRSDLAEISYNGTKGIVNTYLNARRGPSTAFGVRFVYSPKDEVNVLTKVMNADNELWYKIKHKDGSIVYVCGEYLSIIGNSGKTSTGTSTSGNKDNKDNNSDSKRTEGSSSKPDPNSNSNKTNTQQNSGTSSKVAISGKGFNGAESVFRTRSGFVVNGDGVQPVYADTSEKSKQVATTKYNTRYYFVAEYFTSETDNSMSNRWYYARGRGFVNGRSVTVNNYISGTAKANNRIVGRSGAGDKFPSISTIERGAEMIVVANAYDIHGNLWLKVYESGRYKYVRANLVQDVSEEAKKAEEKRQAEEAKKAEQARRAEEARKKAEEAKKAEAARKAAEAKKKAEEARKAAEKAGNTNPSGSKGSSASASGIVNEPLGAFVRQAPSTSSGKVGGASKGTRLEIKYEKFTSSNSNSPEDIWYSTSLGGFLRADLVDASYRTYTGYTTDWLNVRTGAGTGFRSIKVLKPDTRIQIVLKAYDTNGMLWYKIKDNGHLYYVYANYVSDSLGGTPGGTSNSGGSSNSNLGNITNESTLTPLTPAEFEASMNEQGFPESYKPALRELHAKYPHWQFAAKHTGLDWQQALNRQIASSNLVWYSQPEGYKDVGQDSYNFDGGYYYAKDGTTFFKASPQTVAYYMDPRNFLRADGVFMFEDLHYNGKFQTASAVRDVLNSTRMPAGAERYFVEAGASYNVSPVYLACKVVAEIGGTTGNIDGHSFTYGRNTYQNAYNPFNIGASDTAYGNPAAKGLVWAISGSSYLRPWNTLEKSIKGGAMFISSDFIANNQHSMYYERFNVNNGLGSVGTHQYMTAIYGPRNQASSQFDSYRNLGLLNKAFCFEIPVYKNMPSGISPEPPTGHNNAFLKDLSVNVNGKKVGLNRSFYRFTNDYVTSRVSSGASYATINAVPYRSDVSIRYNGGPGNKIYLKSGKNVVHIDVISPSGRTIRYNLTITK